MGECVSEGVQYMIGACMLLVCSQLCFQSISSPVELCSASPPVICGFWMACSRYSGCTFAEIYLYIASYRYTFLLRLYKKIVFCVFDIWKTKAFFLHLKDKEIKITVVFLEKISWKTLSRQIFLSMQKLGSRNEKKENPIKKIFQR